MTWLRWGAIGLLAPVVVLGVILTASIAAILFGVERLFVGSNPSKRRQAENRAMVQRMERSHL